MQTIGYFRQRLQALGVKLVLGTRQDGHSLLSLPVDEYVVATGVTPRLPDIPGVEHSKVLTYQQVLEDPQPLGKRIAILGAGVIGFDMAHYLLGRRRWCGIPGWLAGGSTRHWNCRVVWGSPSRLPTLERFGCCNTVAARWGWFGLQHRLVATSAAATS